MNTPFAHRRRQLTFVLAALGVPQIESFAQTRFPDRPITLVVGWAAGGSADALARLVANDMATTLGQPVIVENRGGAGSNLGSELVAKSKPDGYTIMLATSASHGFNSALFTKLPFRPLEDFAPIGLINTSAGTLLVPTDSPFKTVQDIIQAAKSQPGILNYASAGIGSSQHLAGAMFKKMTGVDIVHIPFKGSAPAMTDLMAGRVDMMITTGPLPYVRGGKVRALAIAARDRHPAMPDVPTFDQLGVKGFYTDNWYGLVAPASTPRAVLEVLNAALNQTLSKPDIQKQFIEQGAFPGKATTPDAFWVFVSKQMPVDAEMVRVSGAKVE